MRTTGVVKWFDRSTGTGVVVLDDGEEECVVRLAGTGAVADDRDPDCAPRGHSPCAPRRRDLRPDIAQAVRAGTWGDGGRDY